MRSVLSVEFPNAQGIESIESIERMTRYARGDVIVVPLQESEVTEHRVFEALEINDCFSFKGPLPLKYTMDLHFEVIYLIVCSFYVQLPI